MKEKQKKAGRAAGGIENTVPKKENPAETRRYPGIQMVRTGKWLRFLCKIQNRPVKEICECLGLGCPQSVYGWFGGRTLPSLDNFYTLSQLLNVPLHELIINWDEQLPGGFCKRAGKANIRILSYRLKLV